MELSWSDLLNRPMIERDITMTCVSNTVGGHYVGTARWIGARLDDLLREAGVQPDADMVVGRSSDGFECGFPVANAMDGRDAIIAVAMNGEPLPLQHGFPARLVVPGLYGFVSGTKWLTEIELTRFDQFEHYWERRGWAEKAPIKLMSRIDVPKGLAHVPAGTVAVGGVAWAQTIGIAKVEVQVDDGDWAEATLADQDTVDTWRQWSYAWDATSGNHSLRVRATDQAGELQTDDARRPDPRRRLRLAPDPRSRRLTATAAVAVRSRARPRALGSPPSRRGTGGQDYMLGRATRRRVRNGKDSRDPIRVAFRGEPSS